MFINHLKFGLRNIRRHKLFSFINIAGLAVGMACFILIMLWVQDEQSYDKFHANKDDCTWSRLSIPMTSLTLMFPMLWRPSWRMSFLKLLITRGYTNLAP